MSAGFAQSQEADMRHDLPVVLITGASSAIGAAVARRYAADGWELQLWHRSGGQRVRDLEAELEALGVRRSWTQVDFKDAPAVERAVEPLRLARVDALVNNAGGYETLEHFSTLGHAEVMESLAVNFTAPFLLAAAVFEGMAGRGAGRMVNISSVAAKYGGSAQSMQYGCAKRALEGITRTLAREGAPCGVLVNTVRPGVIDTGFHTRLGRDMAVRTERIPLGRMGTPEEVAEVAHFLGSFRNTYVTGQTIAVSGGE